MCAGGAVTYSDAMARIIVTAPQLMSVVNEELPGHEVVGGDHFMDRQELSRQIATADAILTSLSDPLDAEMIGQGKNLKVIGQCAAGFNNIDLDAAQQAGVVVTSTPGVLHEATPTLPSRCFLRSLVVLARLNVGCVLAGPGATITPSCSALAYRGLPSALSVWGRSVRLWLDAEQPSV
ncbi:D-isomer specific 2-hydroxyacid dehydrogenase, catalytic domain protein [Cutibacterium acnes HL060PA1]|nr:D-isomer specific 2-hydroxyacid dehydrogenase, catalytic domain protein [Cutibacterium acnes HL060PA1]